MPTVIKMEGAFVNRLNELASDHTPTISYHRKDFSEEGERCVFDHPRHFNVACFEIW